MVFCRTVWLRLEKIELAFEAFFCFISNLDGQHGLRGRRFGRSCGDAWPGGAAEDVTVCLVLGIASVPAIEKKKKKPRLWCKHGTMICWESSVERKKRRLSVDSHGKREIAVFCCILILTRP